MFWFKPQAFEMIKSFQFKEKDFPLEMGQVDGTLSHLIERIFVSSVKRSGFDIESI